MYAAAMGHGAVTSLLLQMHARADLQDKQGLTALMLSCAYDHSSVAALLVQHHASLSIIDQVCLAPF